MSTTTRKRPRLDPTGAKGKLRRKAGTLEGLYYAVGVEVPPRQGASFSRRYTTVPSARAGERLLRDKLSRKRVGMTGHLVVAIAHTNHYVELAHGVRLKGGNGGSNYGTVDVLYPSHTVGDVRRRVARETKRNQATTLPAAQHLRPTNDTLKRRYGGR